MKHLESEIKALKSEVLNMMELVENQFTKSREAITNFDQELAHEVIFNDKRIDAMELKIDRDCENILALHNPVAVDLRFVLAALKINTHLERIGDNAVGIAKYVVSIDTPIEQKFLDEIEFLKLFDNAAAMVKHAQTAFKDEDTSVARKIFKKDELLNKVNEEASDMMGQLIKDHPEHIDHFLYFLSIIRKLERVGDLSKNLAEEIIFYLEAKVLKHQKNKAEKADS